MLSKKRIVILAFGAVMALLVALLDFLEYRYFVGSLEVESYTLLIAAIFTTVGVWIGYNILKEKKVEIPVIGEIDKNALDNLKLNDREYEVLKLIASGKTNKEIAADLFLALPTIKTHTSNLYGKLDVRNRTEAVSKARELRIIN